MKLKECSRIHLKSIQNILNEVIDNSTALFEYELRTQKDMEEWWSQKQLNDYPVIGMFNNEDTMMGFASYGQFRDYSAFNSTVESSVYIHKYFRGRGVAKILLNALIDEAKEQGRHVMVAVIESQDTISIELHKKCGFIESGTLKQVGYKFNRRLDISFLQLILDQNLT